MSDGADNPTVVPAPASPKPAQPAGRRMVLWVSVAAGVGLAVGVLLTVCAYTTYTFFTQTIPSTRDSVEVFDKLNELRQQINQLNEDNKRKEQEKEDAVRQALDAAAAAARKPESGTPGAAAPDKKEGGAMAARPAPKPHDEYAEIDEEIQRLEQTQKVLNNILDIFSRKKEPGKDVKERGKDR